MKLLLLLILLYSVAQPGRLVESAMARLHPRNKHVHISGVVRDWNGEPMEGVTIIVTPE